MILGLKGLSVIHILAIGLISGADPGFEKGGGAGVSEASFRHIWANLENFLKNLAQKRVGVRPLPPHSGFAPGYSS